jgi:hypothetical protein
MLACQQLILLDSQFALSSNGDQSGWLRWMASGFSNAFYLAVLGDGVSYIQGNSTVLGADGEFEAIVFVLSECLPGGAEVVAGAPHVLDSVEGAEGEGGKPRAAPWFGKGPVH